MSEWYDTFPTDAIYQNKSPCKKNTCREKLKMQLLAPVENWKATQRQRASGLRRSELPRNCEIWNLGLRDINLKLPGFHPPLPAPSLLVLPGSTSCPNRMWRESRCGWMVGSPRLDTVQLFLSSPLLLAFRFLPIIAYLSTNSIIKELLIHMFNLKSD